jgi:3-hydroxybutyryl-CoA dehydrogenase
MNNVEIMKIVVCGAGTMGRGIAQVAAQNGFQTVLYDLQEPVLEQARIAINESLNMLVTKGKLSEEAKNGVSGRLEFTSEIKYCKGDLIIEAIIEIPEVKIELFNQLAASNSAHTIFATNTSSLSISQIAEGIVNPERVVGMHFFNPAPVMKLVEVVKGIHTSNETIQSIFSLAKQLQKTPVLCKDSPGFIVNHVARPYYLESLRLIEAGHSDFATIDSLLESTGFKMGPFKLMDLIGNDINFAVSSSVFQQLGKPVRLKPSRIQEAKVEQGDLGKKTGKGYYTYNSDRLG